MIQQEFSDLVALFQSAAEGKAVEMQAILDKTIEFISHLREFMQAGDDEDRKEALHMMNELLRLMKLQSSLLAKKAGATEEQMKIQSENPATYTPEQWRLMQEAKKKLADVGKELVAIMHKHPLPPKKDKSPPSPADLTSGKGPKKAVHKRKGVNKSRWLRS